MKKHISSMLLFLCLIIFSSQLSAMCGTTVLWHNRSDGPAGKDPGITMDVIDQNIDVRGVNALVEGIHVVADSCDILVTVTNEDSVITGSGNRCDNIPTNSARLYLFANTDRTITFSLTSDLIFRGTANDDTLLDLLVSVSGPGEVRFFIEGGQEVCFTSNSDSGGARVFLAMDDPNNPLLLFRRLDPLTGNVMENVEVKVGPRSGITFLAETTVASGAATEEGTIAFDPSNTGTGCTILRLENCSYFSIRGVWLDASLDSEFMLDDIEFNTPAGLEATLIVENANSGIGTPAPLRIINENAKLTNFLADPFCDGAFVVTGTQFGFILGANALLQLNDLTYIDYIGTQTNTVPIVNTPLSNVQPDIIDLIECMKITGVQDLIKERNASAFIVDGDNDINATPAEIFLQGSSAIYFRSGVDCNGDVTSSFTIDPGQETEGAGNIIFDVEGMLTVSGQLDGNTALNVLSLEVTKTGCSVFVESNETQFPQRTFARNEDGDYLQYNKAAWLINNRIDIFNTSIVHTDAIHDVYDRNNLGRSDLSSEPTYIGGETFKICLPEDQERPTIALHNSIFRIHTNVGLTGVDIRIPNDEENSNSSILRFYNNGRRIDDGYGRIMVLGTDEGSLSACGQLIDRDSHLDIFQETEQMLATEQRLSLDTNANDTCITEGIVGDISNQCAVQSIFLNNASNISVGTNGAQGIDINTGMPFDLVTTPSFCISGAFFSFETAGGLWALPEAGGTIGQGAIFVDANGTFKINSMYRASVATMVVKSRNGVINLPKSQVFFDSRVGITQWNINLTDTAQRTLIPAGICLSDFTMDWGAVQKDYTSSNSFVPYEPKMTPTGCECPPVTDSNLRALPMVLGMVDQFQIKRSRLGDQAHLQVKGGKIRELVMLTGCNTAEAPVGFLVVEDEAFVGLGTAHRNVDSLQASVKLGINGMLICANGDATIELNENIIIDNVCAILSGTSFGLAEPQILTIHAQDHQEFRVKSTGMLDLTQFDTDNKILQFAGNVQVVFEPGAQLILGGGTLSFTDQTRWTFQNVLDSDLVAGMEPRDLDDIRVKLIGDGFITMDENATMLLLENQFFGIETSPICDSTTSITWLLNDQSAIYIGTQEEAGGSFQIGNTRCEQDATIDFTLILDGVGTVFEINRQGFLGLAVGMANKASVIPNEWLVNCLENVTSIAIDIREGTFNHNQIVTGDSSNAALLALGPSDAFTLLFNLNDSVIRGGGNLAFIESCVDDMCDEIIKRDQEVDRLPADARVLFLQAQEMMQNATEMMEQAKQMMFSMITRGPNREKIREAQNLMRSGRNLKVHARTVMRNVIISSINPTVQNTAGQISANLEAGIMAGKLLLRDTSKPAQPVNVGPQAFFDYLTTTPFDTQNSPRANVFRDQIELSTVGFVDGTSIRRELIQFILGTNGFNMVDHDHSLRLGALGINLNDVSRDINQAIELRGATAF
ncbi:MAG: hypothetical protein WDZ41_00525 [Candidatus Babeliales bacterium]